MCRLLRKEAFTLLEIIIVIIIIGILATLAVPQYQKLVRKARLQEGVTGLGAIHTAERMYYVEYGTYTTNIADLDIDNPPTDNFTYNITSTSTSTWQATAVPTTSLNINATVTVDQDGDISYQW